jgi:NAD(P)-dependent dehydrogenase (short-subunit alcohol dehydrogenase family)
MLAGRFIDKCVAITGAAGAIGQATARYFAREGARLALFDRDEAALSKIADELGAFWQRCDVSDEDSMREGLRKAALAHDGQIHAGVLNAAISGICTPLQDTDVETFDRISAVNVRGVFLGLKHLFPIMKEQGGGAIIITASTESLRGNAGLSPYVASKHAVLGLARTAALEWARYNVRVNCVNPGPVDTPFLRAVEDAQIAAGKIDVRERNTARIPMRRYAQAEEVAAYIAFLASDEAAYSTGTTHLLDGGIFAGKMED